MPRVRPFLPLLALLAACAQGGKQNLPPSDVQIAADHHLLWFRSLPGFASVAARADAVFSGHGVLALAADSTYRIQLPVGTTDAERYALANDGTLSIFNTGVGREPSTVFTGAYRLVGDRPDLLFTDRVAAGSSPSIGLYYGTRKQIGQVELAVAQGNPDPGHWHVLTLHVMLTTNTATLPRQIARAAHGQIDISAGAPGSIRSITNAFVGTSGAVRGTESGNDLNPITVDFGGSIQNLLDGSGSGDGSCNLTLDYANIGSPVDPRVCRAVAGRDLVMALDDDETDGETGMVFLVRTFDTPAAPAVINNVAGDYLVGGYTVFVNPSNNGSDAFVGTLSLTAQGGFRLDAVGHQGADFSYTGTYVVAGDGKLTLTVSGTNEVWTAAINRTYDSLVLVDDVVENRTNNLPELNLMLGVRKKIN